MIRKGRESVTRFHAKAFSARNMPWFFLILSRDLF